MILTPTKKKLNYLFLILGLILFFLGCNETPNPTSIIQKSIEAHGGQSLWESIQKIEYLKEIKLYDSLGQLEQTILQKHYHQWNPSLSIMEWNVNGSLQRVEKNPNGIAVFENGEMVTEHRDIPAITRIMDAALYVFWQPFKLLDKNAIITYDGINQLMGNQEVHTIRIQYSEEPNTDIWHYYFDTETYLLKATQVTHNGQISLIMNEAVEEDTGLFLNKLRKSYFINADRSIQYLRADYVYTIVSFE